MSTIVNIVFHFGGRWKYEDDKLEYIDGDTDILHDYDSDYLCYMDLLHRYKHSYGYHTVKKILVREPGRELIDGLFLVHDDETIRRVLYYINRYSWVGEIDFFADHEVDQPLFAPRVLEIGWEDNVHGGLNGPVFENASGATGDVNTDEVDVPREEEQMNESVGEQTVHIGTQSSYANVHSAAGSNPTDHTGAPYSETTTNIDGASRGDTSANVTYSYIAPDGYVSEPDNEVPTGQCDGDEDSSEDSDEDQNRTTAPTERVRYDGEGEGHFMLGMTFANAEEARVAISKYAVCFGYKLKLNPNEPFRIVAKCQNKNRCPFMLRISKDGRNPGLSIKTLKADHACFRHYTIPSASAKFLATHFKSKIYHNPAFKVKDMMAEAEELLKITVSLQKCKRAKRMVIQEMDGSYRFNSSSLRHMHML